MEHRLWKRVWNFSKKKGHHHDKEAGHSAIRGIFFQHHPQTSRRGPGAHSPLTPACLGEQGQGGMELTAPESRGPAWDHSWTHALPGPGWTINHQLQVYPLVNHFGLASVLFSPCFSTPDPSFSYGSDPEDQLAWGGYTHTAHYIQSHPRCLLQPPNSYPTRWESSCRLWACRKLALGAGTGGGGAAVMSRETDDNRQTDGTGARGRCASNAHPRPSFGARQSGIQNSIPGERWSRVSGPQLRNLGVEGDLGACQLHLGKRGRATCPAARHWTRPSFSSF